jgi:hypothetical protein
MRNIAELNFLVRGQVEAPNSFKLATETFREGWNFVRFMDARRLEKDIHAHGLDCVSISDGAQKSGVGKSAQEAIANALEITLRHISQHYNIAKIGHIELTQYPWFYLSRVVVCPYRVEQDAIEISRGVTVSLPIVPTHRRLQVYAPALYPYFGYAIPMLKEMLILSKNSQTRPQ